MTILTGYNEVVPVLRDENLGCIPWAIEWMIRYKAQRTGTWEIPEAVLTTFQENYNLQSNTNGAVRNNFKNILREVRNDYPNISLHHRYNFQNGTEKFQRIENLIREDIPVLMPIKLSRRSPAHIMPVVEVNTNIQAINKITNRGNQISISFPKYILIQLHDIKNWGTAIVSLP